MLRPSVLIVGAGLAGLAAARELERRGCDVIVIEALGLHESRILHGGFSHYRPDLNAKLLYSPLVQQKLSNSDRQNWANLHTLNL